MIIFITFTNLHNKRSFVKITGPNNIKNIQIIFLVSPNFSIYLLFYLYSNNIYLYKAI